MPSSASTTTAHHGLPAHEVVLLMETDPLFSLFLTPSERLDLDDADAVTEFVREHVVRGFVEPRSGRPPARQRQVP